MEPIRMEEGCRLRVSEPSSLFFRESIDIIRQSIPLAEQLDEQRLLQLLRRDDYRLYTFRVDDQVAGAAILYLPRGERCGWLDYMAVRSDCRDRGLGSMLFRALMDIVSRERPEAQYVMFEVDDDRCGDDDVQVIARRRLAFYRRLGARLLDNVDYLFPSHHGPPVPMRLMLYQLLKGAELSRETIRSAIEVVFAGIHGRGKDDHLLRSITDALPSDVIVT